MVDPQPARPGLTKVVTSRRSAPARAIVWLLLVGCNSVLGNQDFRGPDAGDECASRGLPPTTLTGTVFAPNGTLPIYNALVYAPTAPLAEISDGASGPICASGSPAATARSDAHGNFKLENVPPGSNVSLVVQIGKWRRVVPIASVPACTVTVVDPGLTRLPRDSTEGHIPHMAITTGISDTLECVARDLGIADSEIGSGPTSTARVRIYASNGVKGSAAGAFEPRDQLLDPAALQRFDAVLLGCEGSANMTATTAGAQAMFDFANRGGWLWVTHSGYHWLQMAPAPWPSLGMFVTKSLSAGTSLLIDQTSPRGQAFADWSVFTGLSATAGVVTPQFNQYSCESADPALTHQLMYVDPASGTMGTQMFTWDAAMGGKLVFSDVHVGTSESPATNYPDECPAPPAAQEKAVLFEMFDLATCVP